MPELTLKLDANERVIGIGQDAAEASRQRWLAKDEADRSEAEADRSEANAAFTEEFSGPAYATQAAGEAATSTGQFFRVWNGDSPRTYTRYERTVGGSEVAAPLAPSIDLGSNDAGKGVELVAGAARTFETVADMLAHPAASAPVGAIWNAGPHTYRVAAAVAADQHLTTAGGVKLYLYDMSDISFNALGADEGAADNSTEIQLAFDLWIATIQGGKPSRLHGEGDLTITSPVVIESTSNLTVGGELDMTGCRIISDLGSAGIPVTFRNRALCRNIDFINLNIYGSANDTITCFFDCGDVTATPKAYFYGCNFKGTRIENAPNIAWQFDGNYFEFVIAESNVICTSTAAGKYGLYLRKTGSNNPSSVDIKGGSYRGGQYALYSVCPDTKVFGGTYIETGEHCIFLQSSNASGCVGVHVENAWVGGSGSNKAGIKITNQGFVKDCYGTSNGTGAQDTVVEVFSAGAGVDVDTIFNTGSTTKAVYVPSGGATNLRIKNVQRSKIAFASLNENRAASVDGNGIVNRQSSASGTYSTAFLSDSVYTHDFLLTGNVTFNAPTNMTVGDKLRIMVQQDATGGRTVTFNASVFRAKTAVDTTANLRTSWEFVFTGGLWIESGVSGVPS